MFDALCKKSTKQTNNRSKKPIKIKGSNKLGTRNKDRWSKYYTIALLFNFVLKVKHESAEIFVVK